MPLTDPKEEKAARQWASVRLRAKLLFWAACLPFLIALYMTGYGMGLLDAYRASCPPPVILTKEATK